MDASICVLIDTEVYFLKIDCLKRYIELNLRERKIQLPSETIGLYMNMMEDYNVRWHGKADMRSKKS